MVFIFLAYFTKIWNASRICVSSLRRGHANLLCIVPILVYVLPKRALFSHLLTCVCAQLCSPPSMGSSPEGHGAHPWPAQDLLSRPQRSTVGVGGMCGEECEPKKHGQIWAWLGGPRQAGNEEGATEKPREVTRGCSISLLQAPSPSCSWNYKREV